MIFPNKSCSYCSSTNTVKRGLRYNKQEQVQLYLCRSCLKTFTPRIIKGRQYSAEAIIAGMNYYNLGFSLDKSCRIVKEKLGFEIQPSSLANWVEEYKDLCRYHRYRPYAVKMFSPLDTVVTATLAHRQLYRFRFHRAKANLIVREDIKHARFGPLVEYLSLVPSECPHQLFQDGLRASEAPLKFNKEGMIVRSKTNYANRLTAFVLQAVKKNKDRHNVLQNFMLANDTVTVAAEVPIYIKREDLAHMQTQLGFEVYKKLRGNVMEKMEEKDLPSLITGHIDLLQIRNGQIHILDYKPNAAKEKPIEQLTLYAMALSRLTGLRMYEFKCAWFDEKNYFEFFPLHAVYKKKSRRKNIRTKEGTYRINETRYRVDSIRPNKPSNYVF
ncbi:MAG: PD-(D/E)XK nuclease family protein [bacterium]|nr:PD-(D/E)XK nuclease family protein [bacterium]